MLFSLFATLSLAKLNGHTWLTWYLKSCAENGGPRIVRARPTLVPGCRKAQISMELR
jgi:hypothetical protein